jgi:hypothetical protein
MQAGALRMNEAGSAFESAIRIEYRPSSYVAALLAIAHLGALAAVALAGIPFWCKALAAGLVAASLLRGLRGWLREFRDPAPPVLQLNGRDEWHLLRANGSDPMSRGTECVVLPWLVVLHLRDSARADRFFILAPDSLPPQVLRRLRVRLRFPLARVD